MCRACGQAENELTEFCPAEISSAKIALPWDLTHRQCVVLALRGEGLSFKAISRKVNLSVITLKTDMTAAYRKMNAVSGIHAAVLYDRVTRSRK